MLAIAYFIPFKIQCLMFAFVFHSDDLDLDDLDLDTLDWNATPGADTNKPCLEDPNSFLERITDKPHGLSLATWETGMLPESPEPISPTLASAVTPSSLIQLTASFQRPLGVPTPFPFPDLLPPSSELPLLDVELGDLTGLGEEMPEPEEQQRLHGNFFNYGQENQRTGDDHLGDNQKPVNDYFPDNNNQGVFSELLQDETYMSPSFMPQNKNVPFNVFLSGHDYTNKMECVNSSLQPHSVHPRLTLASHMPQPHIPPPPGTTHLPFGSSHMRTLQGPPHGAMGPMFPVRPPPVFQNVIVSVDKVCRTESKDEDRVFQCSYPNCGKVYAKSSHLKVNLVCDYTLWRV